MSLLERIETATGEDEIEPGKRLIRVGDDRGVSLSERLSQALHRLAWRTPFHSLRLRGRFPLKLLAVPKDPVAGDKAVGEALLRGAFLHEGHSYPVKGLDFGTVDVSAAFFDYLQGFAWLRDLAAASTRDRGSKLAEQILRKWLNAHAGQVGDPSWRPDLWGRRILFWTAYAPYILSSSDAVYRSTVLNTLARGARHVERSADKTPAGLPRLTAWAGVITAALVVQGGSARLSNGEAGLSRALASAIHDDGGLVSRSPVEQVALVELLGQLRAAYFAGRREMPELLQEALAGSVAALLSVTLGDDGLSSWQGGNMLSKRRIAAAIEGTGVRSRPLRQARGWGYQRLAAKSSVLVFDGAPPPPGRALSGACASTLAFEFSEGADRVIVNCGGVGPATALLAPELVRALRTTAAHSALTLGDKNSTAIHDDGTLGKGVTQVELSRDETANVAQVEASHDGYVRRFGLIHQRQLALSSDGKELTGEDRLVPSGKKRRAEPIGFTARFHLAPAIEVTSTADGKGALLRIRGGSVWQFRCRGGVLATEDSLWIDGEARPHGTLQLVVTGETPPEGATITWSLRRVG
jgi:uncharacterized heparinase superfamily protein